MIRITMPIRRGLMGLALAALVAAACSSSATAAPTVGSPAASVGGLPTAGTSGAPPVTGSVVVGMASTSLGPVLTGEAGLTLYTHQGDSATSSTCTGGCAAAWPPLKVSAGTQATAGPGVTGTLGMLTRDDGTLQVTYNGLPLYYWKSDNQQGDVTGQGINGFSIAKP